MGKGDTHKKKYNKHKTKFIKYELELPDKENGDFYAKVINVLNGNKLKVIDINNIEYQVGIRGNFFFGTKKENLNFLNPEINEYWVLIQKGISKNQYFLKHIYSNNDIIKLQEKGEINNSKINIIELNIEENNINDNDKWLENI